MTTAAILISVVLQAKSKKILKVLNQRVFEFDPLNNTGDDNYEKFKCKKKYQNFSIYVNFGCYDGFVNICPAKYKR